MDGAAPVGDHYRRSRERLTALLAGIDPADWDRPVVACPGWSVHDVLAHLVGTAEDATAGRLTGPPTPAQTAAQVAERSAMAPDALLAAWASAAPGFEELVTTLGMWPAAIDAVSHEHDVRHALDRPGARDDPSVAHLARLLVAGVDTPAAVTVDFGTDAATGGDPDAEPITLTADARSRCCGCGWAAGPRPRWRRSIGPATRRRCSTTCSSSARPSATWWSSRPPGW